MKKSMFRAALALVLLPLCVQAAELDRVVAVVNDEVVLASELRARIQQVERQLAGQGTPKPAASQLRSQVLDRIVMERLQLQMAKQRGLSVDDVTLDRSLQRIAEQNKIAPAELSKAVTKEGLDWQQFRENIRNEIVMARLREREVDATITVTDAEVAAVLQATAQEAKGQEYQLTHILLRAPEAATPEQWMALGKKAEEVMRQIRAGEDFRKLAATYSNAQDAMQGGLIDWRSIESLPPLFADRMAEMQKGDVSKILRSPVGLHIFKLLDVRAKAEAKVEVEQTHARHILIRTTDVVGEAQAIHRLEDLAERIRNGTDFAEMAKVHSSDLTSAKGGDLGWLNAGETVPEFDRAMNALKPGELSGVVASPFGWHLIQVLERRKMDVTADQRKFAARQAVRERKIGDAAEEWLRQVRDTAYVEIKPE
ncbi:peptidylprolyl isomerase [Uliginosibacterium sp. 31-12]|uniref:peptidylprolyl isomerase n=1 Tax=Uliginosibacterium sp. 31-12 TaxID=3062781 RepID=UPI0026E2372F|nr:peptidylprolyl isomerase [Uliginosibacterium sp. 31-12]MDO6387959.1 peptidylprolyl isomerase [Uliginosibacterium sp. 31-12]